MSYPEKNAGYRNKPAWLDRAIAGEKRAGGGSVEDFSSGRVEPLIDQRGRTAGEVDMDEPPTRLMRPSSPEAAQDARDQAATRTRRSVTSPREPGPVTKSLVAAGATPLVLGRMTADTVKGVADRINSPDNRDKIANGIGQAGRRRGGTVKRAGGGPIEGTDAYYADQERKNGVPESKRNYGDPVPVRQDRLRERSPDIQPMGPTGRERIGPDGKVSGFKRGGRT